MAGADDGRTGDDGPVGGRLGPADGASAIPDDVIGAIDRVLAAYARPDAPGAAVAVVRHGRVVFARGQGAARLDPLVPVAPDTAFRLASITKQLTARAIALLVDDGALTLDTPAGALLPGLPAWSRQLRVGHLVAHTAGLPEYETLIPAGRVEPVTDRDVVGILASRASLRSTPGTRFEYSNGGYAMLATIVEEVSGRPFPAFLRDRIFDPLRMAGAVAHVPGRTEVQRRAYGYGEDAGAGAGWPDADQGVTTAVLGDGGVYASALDLALWDAALHRPGYQPDPAALAPYAAPVAPGVRYGFGWYLDTFRGHARQRHEGWSTGFQNEIQRFPEAGLTVVVLTNRASPAVRAPVEAIATRLLPGP